MKAYKLHAPKNFDNFLPGTYNEPGIYDNQVKIAVKAVSLNFRDWALANGNLSYPGETLPFIPLSDASGEVIETGSNVKHIKAGDRVAVSFFPDWHSGPYSAEKTHFALGGTRDGVLAEQVVFDEESVVRIPDSLSYAEAATFPCAAVTAWHALAVEAKLKPGDTVLLLGTGGVSIFGLQIAKMFGAEVIITSGSKEKLARATVLGADHTVNYKEENWQEKVKTLTGGKGVDYILDVVGHLSDSLSVIKSGGTVFLIGMVGGRENESDKPNLRQVTLRRLKLQGIYVGSAEMLKDVYNAFSANHIKPVIDKTFEFDQVKEALTYMGSGSHFGKIVVNV
jgi:NADPH:quinone reductase-like Zn-dependent oxidoreductase